MTEIELGLFDLGDGSLYDADEDIIIETKNKIDKIIKELKAGLFKIGGVFYDADEDTFISLSGGALGGKYKNPLEKIQNELKKEEKDRKWAFEKGPKEVSKLLKKFNFLGNTLMRLNPNLVENARLYEDNYNEALNIISPFQPYVKAGKKLGYEKIMRESVGKTVVDIYKKYIEDNDAGFKQVDYPFNTGNVKSIEYLANPKNTPKSITQPTIEFIEETIEEAIKDPQFVQITETIEQGNSKVDEINTDIEDLERRKEYEDDEDSKKKIDEVIEKKQEIKKKIITKQKKLVEEKEKKIKNIVSKKISDFSKKISGEEQILKNIKKLIEEGEDEVNTIRWEVPEIANKQTIANSMYNKIIGLDNENKLIVADKNKAKTAVEVKRLTELSTRNRNERKQLSEERAKLTKEIGEMIEEYKKKIQDYEESEPEMRFSSGQTVRFFPQVTQPPPPKKRGRPKKQIV